LEYEQPLFKKMRFSNFEGNQRRGGGGRGRNRNNNRFKRGNLHKKRKGKGKVNHPIGQLCKRVISVMGRHHWAFNALNNGLAWVNNIIPARVEAMVDEEFVTIKPVPNTQANAIEIHPMATNGTIAGLMTKVILTPDDLVLMSPLVTHGGKVGTETHQIGFDKARVLRVGATLSITSKVPNLEGRVAMALIPAVQGQKYDTDVEGYYGSYEHICRMPGVVECPLSKASGMSVTYVPQVQDGEVFQWWPLGKTGEHGKLEDSREAMFILYIAYRDLCPVTAPTQAPGSDHLMVELSFTSRMEFGLPVEKVINLRSLPMTPTEAGVVETRLLGIKGLPFGSFPIKKGIIKIKKRDCSEECIDYITQHVLGTALSNATLEE
jgi:hypothetical protein